jgi:hypothetical protein
VSVIAAIVLAVVLALAGLALDGGRLFTLRGELQNAADACALAASRELAGPGAGDAAAPARAEAAGRLLARRHRIDFQRRDVADAQVTVRFGASLQHGAAWLPAADAAASATPMPHVRCTLEEAGVRPWFMQLLGFGATPLRAFATATLVPSQTNCGIPMALCVQGAAGDVPPFGLQPGQWLEGRFSSGGGVTGSFNWVDFSPPAGGASELGDLLRGRGQCALAVAQPVGQPGQLGNAAARAWNTRFGLYQSAQDGPDNAVPDFTGHAYTPQNWPAGASALPDFLLRRSEHAPYGASVADGNAQTGLTLSQAYEPVTPPSVLRERGGDRRLVVAPLVDCSDWAGSSTAVIRAWACVLMLHPITQPGDMVRLEFAGLADAPGSPCATSGLPGGASGGGPRVPALVQ